MNPSEHIPALYEYLRNVSPRSYQHPAMFHIQRGTLANHPLYIHHALLLVRAALPDLGEDFARDFVQFCIPGLQVEDYLDAFRPTATSRGSARSRLELTAWTWLSAGGPWTEHVPLPGAGMLAHCVEILSLGSVLPSSADLCKRFNIEAEYRPGIFSELADKLLLFCHLPRRGKRSDPVTVCWPPDVILETCPRRHYSDTFALAEPHAVAFDARVTERLAGAPFVFCPLDEAVSLYLAAK